MDALAALGQGFLVALEPSKLLFALTARNGETVMFVAVSLIVLVAAMALVADLAPDRGSDPVADRALCVGQQRGPGQPPVGVGQMPQQLVEGGLGFEMAAKQPLGVAAERHESDGFIPRRSPRITPVLVGAEEGEGGAGDEADDDQRLWQPLRAVDERIYPLQQENAGGDHCRGVRRDAGKLAALSRPFPHRRFALHHHLCH